MSRLEVIFTSQVKNNTNFWLPFENIADIYIRKQIIKKQTIKKNSL
jgi:hypothetical protein